MLSEVRFKMFKSFADARMPVEPLTILIGANASGKSNAIDGLQILSGLATNREFSDILDGMRGQETGFRGQSTGIRGGSRGATRYDSSYFQLGCTFDCGDCQLNYEIKVLVEPHIWLESESLFSKTPGEIGLGQMIYKTEPVGEDVGNIMVTYSNKKKGRNPQVHFLRNYSILSQIPGRFPGNTPVEMNIRDISDKISMILRSILILNPVPQLMRDYVHHARTKILPNGENVSAVVANLISKADIKRLILDYLQDYPEQKITNIGVLRTPTGDVMLKFTEELGKDSKSIDVRGMSDGTLRFLAILATLVGGEPETTVVIEEVDNGLYPSRAKKLISLLRELGRKRKIDVIVTTHNPAVLNALHPEDIPGVVICYRDFTDGSSRFISWIDLPNYPELMARGGIGDVVTQGPITLESASLPGEQWKQWVQRRLGR